MNSEQTPFNVRPETLAFIWPIGKPAPENVDVQSYTAYATLDRASFEAVQAAIGWPVTDEQWRRISSEIIQGSMIFVRDGAEPVAVACALRRDDGWAELAWVAVAPEHQGRGLGKMLCSAVVCQIVSLGSYQLYGSTQDARAAALNIYLGIGFHPVYSFEKVERWRSVCKAIGRPFTPALWGWPSVI